MLLILVASFSFAQTSSEITFDSGVKKFNKVDEGAIVEIDFILTYKGNTKLSIVPPKVDCSCTEVVLPDQKIEAHSTNIIKIKFDTKDKIGWQEREVILQFVSDAMDSRSIEKKLVFKGMIKASQATKDAYKLNQKNK